MEAATLQINPIATMERRMAGGVLHNDQSGPARRHVALSPTHPAGYRHREASGYIVAFELYKLLACRLLALP